MYISLNGGRADELTAFIVLDHGGDDAKTEEELTWRSDASPAIGAGGITKGNAGMAQRRRQRFAQARRRI